MTTQNPAIQRLVTGHGSPFLVTLSLLCFNWRLLLMGVVTQIGTISSWNTSDIVFTQRELLPTVSELEYEQSHVLPSKNPLIL